mgnify:CR=1 FL=1
MTNLEVLKLRRENVGLQLEVLSLRSRVNDLASQIISEQAAALDAAIQAATQEAQKAPDAPPVDLANQPDTKAGLTDPE